MNDQQLVSVILPCYQSQKTLQKTLDSIYAQTYPNIEIIAVNDGSHDATLDILSQQGDRITVIDQENRGAAAARNTGFKKSRGSYVLFCDADVTCAPNMLEKMVTTLEKNQEAAYCYSNFKFGLHTFDLFPFDADRLMKENYISTMSLIRRSAFIGFDESLSKFQDWDLWKRMLAQGKRGVWHDERLFSAPMQIGGISGYGIKNFIKLLRNRLNRR